MSNLVEHAMKELEIAGYFNEDGLFGDMLGHGALELVKVFSEQGHSGMSAGIMTALVEKLFDFKPLAPLTGEDDEWNELNDGDRVKYQNKRCSHVFKDDKGQAYDIQGKVFEEPDGYRYTSSESHVNIEFPYTPTTEIVKVQ